ncbi:MAG: DoxX family protein [Gemmatimonadaceae bacterium]
MDRNREAATIAFAIGFICLGVLGIAYDDFALQWQPVPASFPWRTGLAYASAFVSLVGGAGLLLRRTRMIATKVLLPYMLLWLLLKVRLIVATPLSEGRWMGFSEIAVLATASWVLFIQSQLRAQGLPLDFIGRVPSVRIAQIAFGSFLIPVGLSHFIYLDQTVALVPTWLPYRVGWAYVTGAFHIAAGVAVLLSIYPRLAARLEAAMLGVFALLVWMPAIIPAPGVQLNWSAFLITVSIGAGTWVMAESLSAGRMVETVS